MKMFNEKLPPLKEGEDPYYPTLEEAAQAAEAAKQHKAIQGE